MQHPYLREGMAEERIQRLLADARKPQPGRVQRFLAALLSGAGEGVATERCPENDLSAAQLSEAA